MLHYGNCFLCSFAHDFISHLKHLHVLGSVAKSSELIPENQYRNRKNNLKVHLLGNTEITDILQN